MASKDFRWGRHGVMDAGVTGGQCDGFQVSYEHGYRLGLRRYYWVYVRVYPGLGDM